MVEGRLELSLLHALPLDGTMWAEQMELLPVVTYTPTFYSFGDRIESWAEKALALTTAKRLVVVGCSVGGSCALEVAALAPDRVAALVLIGTKASRRLDPVYHASALETLHEKGLEAAWYSDIFSAMFQ
ncbi:alpha/beta fold hydrolase [Rhizobium sullae]|uniref:Alpha/beta hydrolase family protein n=1 Tax=Rhizobium sullae TaxID=50338 RepID=A0A4R3PUR6_RHISU|nr:alpha/beta fold hydrolase [Rhizobium sullae]TCU10036.1 alpha/beta hydrolase family protein [Rhizobium sullae]